MVSIFSERIKRALDPGQVEGYYWNSVGILSRYKIQSLLPVNTKTDFVRRYGAGEFGNRSPTWDSVADWIREVHPDYDSAVCLLPKEICSDALFHLRNRVAGGLTTYNVPHNLVLLSHRRLVEKGVKESDIYLSKMCPTERTTIQGEVMRTPNGLYLYYSRVKKPMRDSLREGGTEARGLLAKSLLETYLNGRSYEWLNTLLDRYPNHVVEFTALNKCWGTDPGFNTLFWEVRLY